MTLEQFQCLPPASRLAWVMKYGTYLAHRWEGDSAVTLFHLPLGGAGFFAEVGITQAQDTFVLLRSFDKWESVEEYVASVRLAAL